MTKKWLFLLQRTTRRIWFRASLYCGLGLLAALTGAVLEPVVPPAVAERFGADSVGNILSILATSMLAVTTFSVATMVSAHGTASQTATPRAAKLLIEDNSAQGALATFIGAFLFSIVGLIALSTRVYGAGGRLVLFVATVVVIILITATLLRWIEQLSRFGRVDESIALAESATRGAMQRRAREPRMGGSPIARAPPTRWPVEAGAVGYVEYLDMASLCHLCEEYDLDVRIESLPGAFVARGRPLARLSRDPGEDALKRVRAAFIIGASRTFEHDPRYGLVVLTEIAVRALSPGSNDPGTCIDVIGTVVRLLSGWADARVKHAGDAVVAHPRVFVPEPCEADMFDDVFPLISRDGAHLLEVGVCLQEALAGLAALDHAPCSDAARAHARQAMARSLAALDFEPDRDRLRAVALREGAAPAALSAAAPT